MKMGKKALLAFAFVAVAVVSGLISGAMVLAFEMYQGSVGAKSASQEASVEIAQTENEEMTFSCEVSGCTVNTAHTHGACGIDGCTQIGEHSHGICGIAGCTETGAHMHDGEYCYPHSADDGHAYHTCGVSGCTQTGDHSHGGDHKSNGGHHSSGHKSGHH